ncbi:MAG: AbrB/MazE/SpoVT family DNA-binding domain-containing protein [Spirochaetia bacterium]|jgi:antitoxin MazE|nr:AbrB/MazE/SpoVT family DNA-binding domain-containing protein [Spirochaetia bacterium]
MILTINKWGNSQGIRLPKDLMNKLHVTVGTSLNAEFLEGRVIIEPVSSPLQYDIHELVKNIPKRQMQSEVDWGKPEGNEIW